jgi:ABC-type transporter Mla MlaB component
MLSCELEGGRLALKGELQVGFLERTSNRMAETLASPDPLVVDVAGVSEVDLAGVQLLLSFLQSKKNLAAVSLDGVAPIFAKALELTGLAEHYAPFMD